MAQNAFRLSRGDTLALPDGVAGRQLWRVVRRVREGYQCSTLNEQEQRIWTHDELLEAWCGNRMEHWPANLARLDEALAAMLQTDFDNWSPEKQFEAQRRERYVQRVDQLVEGGVSKSKAYYRAAKEVAAEFGPEWERRAAQLHGSAEALAPRRIKARSLVLSEAPVPAFALGEAAVKKWWLIWAKAGRDIRALISRDHLRGDHKLRYPDRRGEQSSNSDYRCVYGAMEWYGRSVYMGEGEESESGGRPTRTMTSSKAFAYKKLSEGLEAKKLPVVSATTFNEFLRDRFDAFDQYRARFGPRAAYLKFHIFQRRALPERAMEEVEVDHCLLDVFVKDRHGRVARPWLTVLICRATKMICGIHIGFDPPASDTLARAVLHAILPKVLHGTGAKNDWPCMGGFDMLITDRGLEFLSEKFQRAGHQLKFAVVNLPGRSPWLKGTCERFFSTLGVRVLSHVEGTTRAKAPDWYDPQARARWGLNELTAKVVRWIVDDYHEDEHATLGVSPRQRWRELVQDALDGGVRPPPPFRDVFRMLGEGGITRVIGNTGIMFDNNLYTSPELERFRRTHEGKKPVDVIAEYFDRSFIWVKLGGSWHEVPATNSSLLKGRSRYAHRLINRLARKLTPKGQEVTLETLDRARIQCEEEARTLNGRRAIRFGSEGALATDVFGNQGRLHVLANGLHTPEPADDVEFDGDPIALATNLQVCAVAAAASSASAEPEPEPVQDERPEPVMQDLDAILDGLSGVENVL